MKELFGSFGQDLKEEIRSKIDLTHLIGRYVKLKPAGQNLKGFCPFHKEKAPSFTVNPAKEVFHCFGCGKGGDIFTFLMEIEGYSFPEAVKALADEAGISYSPQKNGNYPPNQNRLSKTEALSIHEMAAKFFYNHLKKSSSAISYLKSRNITPEIAKKFRLGYAPDGWHNFINHATKYKITKEKLCTSGLAVSSHEKSCYDRFRNRLIFPIFDISGRPIAFAGRSLEKEGNPKYLNSPETIIYHKHKILYGLSQARTIIREKKFIIVVEGYMDFLSLYQAGVKNVVATCGTALTAEHGQLIKRFTSHLVFVFDGDDAGIAAAEKAIFLLIPQNFEMQILILPHNEDPDTYINKHGLETFNHNIENAQEAIHFVLTRLTKKYNTNTTYGKTEIIKHLAPLIQSSSDPINKANLIKRAAEILDLKEQLVVAKLRRLNSKSSSQEEYEKDTRAERYLETEEGSFLHIIVKDPSLITMVQKYIAEEYFSEEVSKKIYSLINSSYNKHHLIYNNIIDCSDDIEIKKVLSLMMVKEITSQDQQVDLSHKAKRFIMKSFKIRKHSITQRIKQESDPNIRVKLLTEQQNLITQYGELTKGW